MNPPHNTTNNEISPSMPNRKRDRVSCEPCRTRKIRCPGERPVCSRCVSTRRECLYSMRMPMGRPKSRRTVLRRGRLQWERQTELSAAPIRSISPSSQAVVPIDSAASVRQSENAGSQSNENTRVIRPVQAIPTSATPPPYLVDFENYQRARTTLCPEPPTAFPAAIINPLEENNCACLSLLYLLLDQLRMKTELRAPDDLALLGESLEMAHGILSCEHCPRRYFSVIQNAVLLGVLCMCLAECYARIVESVNTEEKRATTANEQKRLSILGTTANGFNQGQTDARSTPASFSVEITSSEWGSLMRSAVRAEIFGSETDKGRCFTFLIERLAERQRRWHETPPAEDCPPSYRSSCRFPDRTPTCLMIINDARRLLDSLDL